MKLSSFEVRMAKAVAPATLPPDTGEPSGAAAPPGMAIAAGVWMAVLGVGLLAFVVWIRARRSRR